jgi:hypothetical protein
MNAKELDQPIRVGVFDSVRQADEAVRQLLDGGFATDQITVICSEETVQKHFAQFEHQDPAGSKTPAALLAGGTGGAALGALTTIGLASIPTLGGAALIAAGGVAMWGGAVAGGLIGAMMTRGFERSLANYYDQAVTRGKILVAADEQDRKRAAKLEKAAEIFAEHGVEPLPLEEG